MKRIEEPIISASQAITQQQYYLSPTGTQQSGYYPSSPVRESDAQALTSHDLSYLQSRLSDSGSENAQLSKQEIESDALAQSLYTIHQPSSSIDAITTSNSDWDQTATTIFPPQTTILPNSDAQGIGSDIINSQQNDIGDVFFDDVAANAAIKRSLLDDLGRIKSLTTKQWPARWSKDQEISSETEDEKILEQHEPDLDEDEANVSSRREVPKKWEESNLSILPKGRSKWIKEMVANTQPSPRNSAFTLAKSRFMRERFKLTQAVTYPYPILSTSEKQELNLLLDRLSASMIGAREEKEQVSAQKDTEQQITEYLDYLKNEEQAELFLHEEAEARELQLIELQNQESIQWYIEKYMSTATQPIFTPMRSKQCSNSKIAAVPLELQLKKLQDQQRKLEIEVQKIKRLLKQQDDTLQQIEEEELLKQQNAAEQAEADRVIELMKQEKLVALIADEAAIACYIERVEAQSLGQDQFTSTHSHPPQTPTHSGTNNSDNKRKKRLHQDISQTPIKSPQTPIQQSHRQQVSPTASVTSTKCDGIKSHARKRLCFG
jgi:hypothetical protein